MYVSGGSSKAAEVTRNPNENAKNILHMKIDAIEIDDNFEQVRKTQNRTT